MVHATVRDLSRSADLLDLPGAERLAIHKCDVNGPLGHDRLIAEVHPDEFYNLAGQSSVSESFRDPSGTWRTNADAVQGMLEAVRLHSPATHFYQASSTEMFGAVPRRTVVHDEASPFMPQSPYAAAKAAAHLVCDAYRRAFDLRIACGILSNHESHRRPQGFLTRKVVDYVRRLRDASAVKRDLEPPLAVGNLAARRDWGFAPDYVEGIIRITRQIATRARTTGTAPEPDVGSSYRDYVLGSGQLHAVWELIDRAFALGGIPIDWDRASPDPGRWSARFRSTGARAVVVDPSLTRPADPAAIGTDPSRARMELGWEAPPSWDRFLVDLLTVTHDVPAARAADQGR